MLGDNIRTLWHKSAPQAVRRAFASGEDAEGWTAWQQYLAQRKAPTDPAALLPGDTEPLSWALPDGLDSVPVPAWLNKVRSLPAGPSSAKRQPSAAALESEVFGWLRESACLAADGKARSVHALETLACGRVMHRLAAVLPPRAWWALLDRLLATVDDAAAIDLDNQPLAHQLLAGELAVTLAHLLPEITPCRKLKSMARRALSEGLIDLLDGEGLPHGKHLSLMRPLLACWTRCRALGEHLKGGCFTAPAVDQYGWLVHEALRLARHDGTHVLSNGSAPMSDAELFQAALQFGDDDDDRQIAALILPWGRKNGKKGDNGSSFPEPAVHSEWAATAVLRPRWSRSGERLTVVYPGQSVKLELSCGKDVLWSGEWGLEVSLGGRPALPTSDWDQVCWLSDDDADYIELEIELETESGGKLRVQRQIMLARQNGFLLLADSVLGDPAAPDAAGKLDYRGRLPLCPGVYFRQATESREGFLGKSKRRALVMPLALPEWRSDQRIGELRQTDRGLELCQATEGRCLYAPLFFDLDRDRQRRRLSWRQLTVAESLVEQPASVAAGYRVAVADEQWLIYRSLAEKANRTLLGHNLSTEMLVAQFDPCGEVHPLVEIE